MHKDKKFQVGHSTPAILLLIKGYFIYYGSVKY